MTNGTGLREEFEQLKRDQRKLEARFVDLKSRFDGQGGALAESARWIEKTMGEFETKVEKTLRQYKDLLDNLSAFDFGTRLEQVEKQSNQMVAQARDTKIDIEQLLLRTTRIEKAPKLGPEPEPESKLLGEKDGSDG